jgi:hypothetical protein
VTTATLDDLRQAFGDLVDGVLGEVEALKHEILVLTAERDEARATVLRLLQAFAPPGRPYPQPVSSERALEPSSQPESPPMTAVCRCGKAFEKRTAGQTLCHECKSLIARDNWNRSKEQRDAARLQRRAEIIDQKFATTGG